MVAVTKLTSLTATDALTATDLLYTVVAGQSRSIAGADVSDALALLPKRFDAGSMSTATAFSADLEIVAEPNTLSSPVPGIRWNWNNHSWVNGLNAGNSHLAMGADISATEGGVSFIEFSLNMTSGTATAGQIETDVFRAHGRTYAGSTSTTGARSELHAGHFRCTIQSGATGAHIQPLSIMGQMQATDADGKIVLLEAVVENDGTHSASDDFADPDIKKAFTANSDGDEPAFGAFVIGGSLASGWDNGLAAEAGTLGDSIVWYENVLKLTAGGRLGLGNDSPQTHIDIQDATQPNLRFFNTAGTGSAGLDLASVFFRGPDSSNNVVNFGNFIAEIAVASATEKGMAYRWLGFVDNTSQDMMQLNNGNLGINGSSYGGAIGAMFLANAVTAPGSNPTAGGLIYVDSNGDLTYRGSGGNITTLATA